MSGGGATEYEDELFTLAYEDGVKDKYMCHVYEKSERHGARPMYYPRYSRWMYSTESIGSPWCTTAKLHMVITYSTSHWSQVGAVTEGLHHKCHVQ